MMNWQHEFPQQQDLIYLNHAAVSPWPRRTQTALNQFAKENVILGAKNYPRWLAVEYRLRQRLQRLINAPSDQDIALLKNTSEALSVIAYGLDWHAGDNLIISNQEFPSNRIVWESLSRLGVEIKVVNLDSCDKPEQAIVNTIDERTRLISLSSVQYASGLKLDCKLLGEACRQHKVLFCIDAIQSIGAHHFDVQEYQADFVVADGHKWMMGPEGLALFYSSAEVRQHLTLRQFGWHMVEHRGDYERLDWKPAENATRFECGSPNMLGVYALEASLSLIEEIGMDQIEHLLKQKIAHIIDQLELMPEIEIIGPPKPAQSAGIVTFKHKSVNAKELHQRLQRAEIICAHRGGGVRFSPHFYTPMEKIDKALELVLGQ